LCRDGFSVVVLDCRPWGKPRNRLFSGCPSDLICSHIVGICAGRWQHCSWWVRAVRHTAWKPV